MELLDGGFAEAVIYAWEMISPNVIDLLFRFSLRNHLKR